MNKRPPSTITITGGPEDEGRRTLARRSGASPDLLRLLAVRSEAVVLRFGTVLFLCWATVDPLLVGRG
ncbi:MAG: hypothetical protein OSB10_02515 [Planctomycetota bacterium]|nr:hypothetical protein [Planctomycetota bacterium]